MYPDKEFDVIIIGAGVIGSAIARYLTRFKANILVLEKHNDVGDEASGANSGIVHSGYDPLPSTNKAKFNVLGATMMRKVCEELDVPYQNIGSLTISFNEEDNKTLLDLQKRGFENGVVTKILTREETLTLEPNLSKEVCGALLAPTAGIVSPFELTVKLMENAIDNGAVLKLNSEVTKIKKIDGFYKVFCKNGKEFISKCIVDAAGLYSDKVEESVEKPKFKITPRKGEYFVLDHFDPNFIKHTIFMCPTKVGKGVLISQTTSGNYLVGPSNDASDVDDTSTDAETLNAIKKTALKICPSLPFGENIRQFTGIRPNSDFNDFVIEESSSNPNFFIVGGIMSPGLASSVAIGEYVSDLIKNKLNLSENKAFNPKVRKHSSLKKLATIEFNKLIQSNPLYGHLICRCEKISEAEIVDAIHRNCGARTIKGVKKRVRPGFGKCQGTFCESEVAKILARELNTDISNICYSELGTNVVLESLKGAKDDK